MLDRKYFEEVLLDQLRLMGGPQQPLRLTVRLTNGEPYDVHGVLAAHDAYVVLKIHGTRKPPEHPKPWQRANPGQDAAIYDQVCVPYSHIFLAHLTARTTQGEQRVGFQQT